MKHEVFVFDSTAESNQSRGQVHILFQKNAGIFCRVRFTSTVFILYLKAVVIISALMLDSRESKVTLLSTCRERSWMRTDGSSDLLQFVR